LTIASLLDAAANWLVQVLGACQQPTILATSRSPLEPRVNRPAAALRGMTGHRRGLGSAQLTPPEPSDLCVRVVDRLVVDVRC
jgi:hypothetical protein